MPLRGARQSLEETPPAARGKGFKLYRSEEQFPLEVGRVTCGLCDWVFVGPIEGAHLAHRQEGHPERPEKTTVLARKAPREPTAREVAQRERRAKIIATLTAEPQSTTLIAAIVGVPATTVASVLSAAIAAGGLPVHRVARGVFSLPPAPKPEPDPAAAERHRLQNRDAMRRYRAKIGPAPSPPDCPKCGRRIRLAGAAAMHAHSCTGGDERLKPAYLAAGHVILDGVQIRRMEEALAAAPMTREQLAGVLDVDSRGLAVALMWAKRKQQTRIVVTGSVSTRRYSLAVG